ncbi:MULTISPECIES: AMP-binding protein [unclassified Rhizobium]|uniref:AMP-binding protein n=1 Tax=Rhizobium sp. 16-488-2a TaxID=2819990 RepID=UPI001AD98DC7|nr:AMP-binding protein [Rhizobium sp. 16-488-2a]MBO9178299.1 AMP-binding protein [Rhizobium sp. 16-488-2a]
MAPSGETARINNDSVVAAEDLYLQALRVLWEKNWPQHLKKTPQDPMPGLSLPQRLAEWAQRTPDKIAIWFYGRSFSYRQLFDMSERFGARLLAEGVKAGDRVALFMPNCPQFTIAFLSILRIGAVHCPISPMAKREELEHELKDSGARVIVALQSLLPVVETCEGTDLNVYFRTRISDALPAVPELPVPAMVLEEEPPSGNAIDFFDAIADTASPAPVPRTNEAALDRLASINYTSGTTSLPKGCLHTQAHMLYTAAANHLRETSFSETTLNFFPQFWIAGQNHGLVYQIFSGTTLVLLSRWDPLALMMAVENQQVGATTMLVDNLLEVMDHPRFHEFNLSSLKLIRCVSFVKKLDIGVRKRWTARYPNAVLSESAWGMTETHTANTVTIGFQEEDFDLKSRPTFVGLPSPGTDFKICDFETGELLPLGSEGELCCRSPAVFNGYLNAAAASREALREGWVHSGDIGQIDTEGFIHYLGRKKDLIKVNGMSVAPAEIETILAKQSSVLAVGVVARLDELRGEVPVAFVELQKESVSTSEAELVAWCRDRIASYKVPEVRIVKALPLGQTGKIHKETLKDWARQPI